MAELNLALKLKAQDQASRVFRRAQSQIRKAHVLWRKRVKG